MRRYLITGGAGFIGSAVVRRLMEDPENCCLVVDKLTYAGNREALSSVATSPRFSLEQEDIRDAVAMRRIFSGFSPDVVMHLAAESHVDRSIDGPAEFVQTNIVGTFTLLQEALGFWRQLRGQSKDHFRFHHISTDEVFGSLGETDSFSEETPYRPNSPYAASKASADHLVRAWHHTYGLPVVLTNCSNNYGPYHFPEKLIPLMIINALGGQPLPVYGNGKQIRDWLHVEDHADALLLVAERGTVGQSYNIGARNEISNLNLVLTLCEMIDELAPSSSVGPRKDLIVFVGDRPGHDVRYAIDPSKIERELGWQPRHEFKNGLRRTVQWYIDNQGWWETIRINRYSGERLGLSKQNASG